MTGQHTAGSPHGGSVPGASQGPASHHNAPAVQGVVGSHGDGPSDRDGPSEAGLQGFTSL